MRFSSWEEDSYRIYLLLNQDYRTSSVENKLAFAFCEICYKYIYLEIHSREISFFHYKNVLENISEKLYNVDFCYTGSITIHNKKQGIYLENLKMLPLPRGTYLSEKLLRSQ